MSSPSCSRYRASNSGSEQNRYLDTSIGPVELVRDPRIEAIRHAADYKFRTAGAIFLNSEGAAVQFDDLDFDRQVSLLCYYTFPVDGEEVRRAYDGRAQRARRVAGGEDAEMEDVIAEGRDWGSGEREMEPALAPGPQGGTGALDGEGSVSEDRLPTPYERLIWTDDSKRMVRRCQPGVERWWHPSKTRRAERVTAVEGNEVGLHTSYARGFDRYVQAEHRERWRTDIKFRSSVERILE